MADAIRVLYVDDEPDLLDICRLFLESSGDFSVTTVCSAPPALDLIAGEQFDAIVSDYQMPGMDGIELLKKVRSSGNTIPFILFTGKGREEVVIQALNEGADFYLQKGGEPEAQFAELTHKVRLAVSSKKAVGALKKSEEKYRQLIEHANEAIVVAQDGMLKLVNRRAIEMTGYSEQELLSMPFSGIINPADRAMVVERFMRRLKGEELPSRYEFRLCSKEGDTCWVELSAVVIDWDGRPATLNFISDVTGRKQADEALQTSMERYKTISEVTTDFVFSCIRPDSGTYSIDWMAGAVEQITGYTIDELIALGCWRCLVHPEDALVFDENVTHLPAGTSRTCILRIQTKNGDTRWLEVQTSNNASYSNRIFGGCRDITERRQMEDARLANENRLQMAQEIGHIGCWEYDITTNLMWGSEEGCHLFGYPRIPGSFPIEDFTSCIVERELVLKAFDDLIHEGKDYDLVFTINPNDGSARRTLHNIGKLEKDEQGNPVKVKGITQDITERKRAEEALQENEEKYRGIFDESVAAVYVFDDKKNFINSNQAGLDLLGYSREELLHMSIPDVDADPVVVLPAHQELLSGGRLINYEHRLRRKDETIITVVNNSSPLTDLHGNVVGMISTLIDITGRKRAEDTLKMNQVQLAEAMDLANMANWEYDATTGIFTFDDRFYALYGTTAELEGGNRMPAETYAKKFVHPDDQHLVADEANNAIRATDPGYVSQVEHRIIRRDGEIRTIVVRFGITKDEHGRTIKTHGVNQDITNRKCVEEALQHLTEFQESIITNARVWLSVLDLSGKILIWNTAAEEISGYRSEEVLGHKEIWKKIYPDKEYRKQITDTINRIIRDKNYLENFETTIRSKDGTKKVISWNTRGIPGATGSVSDYIAIGVDITDRIRAEELRYESERRMTDIISFLPDATLVIDKNGVVLAWNRAMEEMTGVPAADIIGKGNYEYALPFYHERRPITVDLILHDDPAVVATYPVMQTEGKSRSAEIFIPHLNKGKGAYLWFKASPLYDADGNLTGAIESIRDITGRKQAEEEIQKIKETYRELVESISDVIFEIDCDGKISYISPVVHKVLEFEPEEMAGKNFIDFVYPDDRDLMIRRFSSLSEGIEYPSDYRVTTKSGNIRWVRTQTKPAMMGKTFCGARGTLIDITERKRAEEALRESEEKFRVHIENSFDVIFTLDSDGKFIFISPAWERHFGIPVSDILGKSFVPFVHPDDMVVLVEYLKRVLDTGQSEASPDYRVRHADGRWLWFVANGTPYVTTKGEQQFVGVGRDITGRKMAEEAIRSINKKLNLLSGITRHDISNQMTVLQGYLAILKNKQPDPSLTEYFQKAAMAAQRILSMIRFTKEYESIGVTAPVWQDCRKVADTAAKETTLGQVMVKNDLPAGGEIFADSMIVKVFYNLMDNSVRYGGKITTIRFSALERDGNHVVVCEDDGDGVIAEEKEKIFERGFGKNTGMGLFLVREILSITGITIIENGEPGKGARFEIVVPKGMYRVAG